MNAPGDARARDTGRGNQGPCGNAKNFCVLARPFFYFGGFSMSQHQTASFLTMRQFGKLLLKEQVNMLIDTIISERDDGFLLTVTLARGKDEFRQFLTKELFAGRSTPVVEFHHLADSMWTLFERVYDVRYGRVEGIDAKKRLDRFEEVTPPTQKEIDEAWEVDSASSEEGRRYFYGPDGHANELIAKLRDPKSWGGELKG